MFLRLLGPSLLMCVWVLGFHRISWSYKVATSLVYYPKKSWNSWGWSYEHGQPICQRPLEFLHPNIFNLEYRLPDFCFLTLPSRLTHQSLHQIAWRRLYCMIYGWNLCFILYSQRNMKKQKTKVPITKNKNHNAQCHH